MKCFAAAAAATVAGVAVLAACYSPPSTDCSANECRVSFSKQYQIDLTVQTGDPGYESIAVDYLCGGEATWRRAGYKNVLTATTLSDGDTIRTQVYCANGILDAHGVDHA